MALLEHHVSVTLGDGRAEDMLHRGARFKMRLVGNPGMIMAVVQIKITLTIPVQVRPQKRC
jgi:hypothetical protein